MSILLMFATSNNGFILLWKKPQKYVKHMMIRKTILVSLILAIFFVSCTKHEGEGGTSTIKGKVMVTLCSDDFSKEYATFPDEERDVYIMYGSDDFYSDKTDTHYDGTFRFKYLRKGNYKVYAYSDDKTGQSVSGKVAVVKDVKIDNNGKIIEAPVIHVYDQVSNYEGSSSISGRVYAYDWNSELTILKAEYFIRNRYVYIARKGDNYYFERLRTFYDGSFVFNSLPIGSYQIYVYSRDIEGIDPQDEVPIILNLEIEENVQAVDAGIIEIII